MSLHLFIFLFYTSLILCYLWNLKSSVTVSSFCISEHLTGIHMQILSLVTAIYPTVLVILTCILIELHARNYRVIHALWNPFGTFLKRTNITTATSDAVIPAFATLILLSNITPVYIIGNILIGSNVYRSANWSIYKHVLHRDPTVDWFSHKHIEYTLIAVVPFIFVTLIPSLLLCVYPTRLYRYLSQFISARKRLAITAFVEALHNCYKDGLNGTRDFRALAGFFPLYPLLYTALRHVIVAVGYHTDGAAIIIVMVSYGIISYLKPFKQPLANLSLSYHCVMIGILSIAESLWKDDLSTGTETLELTIIIIPIISHVLIFMWVGYTITQ